MLGAIDNETGALILTTDGTDLAKFISALRDGAAVDIPVSPAPPRVSTRPITQLKLLPIEAAPLLAEALGDRATISGSTENLSLWATELSEFGRENDLNEPGMHAHFDPAEQRSQGVHMSSDSAELIVTGPFSDG